MAQLFKHLTSAQAMISWVIGLSAASCSVLAAHCLETALDSVSPSLSLCPSPAHALSLSVSQKKMNKYLKIKKKEFGVLGS